MTIQELYCDEKFNSIVYFLNARGFSSFNDLQFFDFDELLFVPGVSADIVESAKNLYNIAAEKGKSADRVELSHQENGIVADYKSLQMCIVQDQDNELQQTIAECIGALYNAVQRVRNTGHILEIQTLIAEINTPEEINKDILIGICDDLKVYAPTVEAITSEGIFEYTTEEKERLLSAEIEPVFTNVKRGKAMIRYCRENGITNLWDLRSFDFAYDKIKGMGPDSAKECQKAYRLAVELVINPMKQEVPQEKSPVDHFKESYSRLKESARRCLLLKAQGQTLQEIGDSMGLTRERVRQIISKAVRKLAPASKLVISNLLQDRTSFCKADVKKIFSNSELLDCITYVFENTEIVKYFEFADKYVEQIIVPDDWKAELDTIVQNLIGDAVNFFEILEEVEAELGKSGLGFLDASDFMGYLFEKRYIAMGDYIMKKRSAYKRICYDVIARHFKTGIKLDSDENNSDMQLMREIIRKEFAGYTLPDNNRAITARVSPDLILCGRGRYCAPENVVLDKGLFEQIVDYINNCSETTLYYSEIFAAFLGRLLAETSVDNDNYLHGALKYLYPDDFEYERDLLVKHGMARTTFGERLADIIRSKGGPITKKELSKQFPGVTDIRIVNAVLAGPKLIQGEYNEFNHIDNVLCTDGDTVKLYDILEQLLGAQGGYCSEHNLFACVQSEYPEFINKNDIKSSMNLFYIAAYLFGATYRFSRPHIASNQFPNIELTNKNIARFFVSDRPELEYQELVQISQKAGWSNGTFTIILNAVEEDYIKVELNRYIHRSVFCIAPDTLNAIKAELIDLTGDSGYYGIFAIFNYEDFPAFEYEWNEFLLQSIIENYDTGFRVLEPKVKDWRYKRGIIVPMDNPCSTYEDFVIAQMKKDGIHAIEKDAFSGYLRRKGLVLTATIPMELYEDDGLRLEGNCFVFE